MDQSGSTRNGNLEQAFHVFNDVCRQLEGSYRVLENRVAQLNEELAAARSERLHQLIEKERLANRLKCLLDALPAGVVVIDGNGIVQDCNPVASALLMSPLIGSRWDDVARRTFIRFSELDQEATLKDGRIISLSRSPLGTEPGQIVLIIDITETRALQEVADRHKRLTAMGEMAASLAHQVRTPLASALLYASQLGEPSVTMREQQGFSQKILANLRRLEHLVSDMLAFAKGGSFHADDVDISQLLSDLHQTVESQLLLHNCALDISDEAGHAVVRGNHSALLGALQNLVTNAIQACGEKNRGCGGSAQGADDPCMIKLTARVVEHASRGRTAELTVVDRGPGIPREIIDRIFEPFFTTREEGTGLGLAIVQTIIQAHDGSVTLDSRRHRGTAVTVRLPIDRATDRGMPHTAPPSRGPDENDIQRWFRYG
jgi:two-component system sensor histidine kinase FlrB